MSDDHLKQKYALSGQQLQAVKRKLASLELVPQPTALRGKVVAFKPLPSVTPSARKKPKPSSDVEHITNPRSQPSAVQAQHMPHEWTCPACGLRQAQQYDECPKCGIVVAKLSAAPQAGPYAARLAERWPKEKESASGTGWGITVGLVAIIIVGIAIFKWSPPANGPAGAPESAGAISERPADVSDDSTDVSEGTAMPSEDLTVFSEGSSEIPEGSLVSPEGPTEAPEAPAAVSKGLTAAPRSPKYETGFVKDFSMQSFGREVVAASRHYPVLVEFYSDT